MALASSHRVHQWISDRVRGSRLILLLLLSNLLLCQGDNVPPYCKDQPGECRIPLQILFDRATMVANYNHRLANEMSSKFDKQYGQGKTFTSMILNNCHTNSISTPNNKEEAQNTKDETLFSLVHTLLLSWNDPLYHLVTDLPGLKEVSPDLVAKAIEMEEQNKQLLEGVEVIQKRIYPGEKEKETYPVWSEKSSLTADDDDVRQNAFYKMFHCLRRDSSKINTYLQMLRCHIVSCEPHN